ncbi:hypothetical protein M1D93_13140 [Arthrobacter sp. Z1-9]
MIADLLLSLSVAPADYQAERAADAAWETARWTWWLVAGTFLLFGGAVAAAIYASRSWKAAKEQLSIMREDREIDEATKVSGWLHQEREGGLLEVRLRNANHAPIYDVQYKVFGTTPGTEGPVVKEFRSLLMAVLPPSPEVGFQPAHQIASDGFMKGEENSFFVSSKSWKPWNGQEAEPGVFLELAFVDSKGIQWQRNALGALSKVSSHQKP